MDEKFIKLTNSAYKIIEFFPESDPLKNKAKDKVLSIMDNLTALNLTDGWVGFQTEKTRNQILQDIEILLNYFAVAKHQGWLSSINFLIFSNEYSSIRKEISLPVKSSQKINFEDGQLNGLAIKTSEKASPISKFAANDESLTQRQKKILDFLDKNEKVQVNELEKFLNGVTKRTIRRDLDNLLKRGKIVRLGEFNQVFYKKHHV